MVNPARTVVYRHPCDCDSASRPLGPGEKPEHRFEVDGKPFPFHITEDGATFAKIAGGAHLVTVTLLPLMRSTSEPLRLVVDLDGLFAFEHVNGRREVFPWLMIDEPASINCGTRRSLTTVTVTFIADTVDTDTEVTEEPEASPS